MPIPIHQYFKERELFDPAKLKEECERSFVKMRPHPEFPHLVVLNYLDNVQYDGVWNNFNRRCRGLVVDLENKEIAAHPFDKFFGLGQMPETSYENLLKKGGFKIAEKLDGTMITAFYNKTLSTWMCSTRSEFGNAYAAKALEYLATKRLDALQDFTLVFELIDPVSANVIDYRKKAYEFGLYLIGMRNRKNDLRLGLEQMTDAASSAGFFLPKVYTFDSLDAVVDTAKDLPYQEEGYVLNYHDGDLVKIKSLEYCKMHRIKHNYSEDRVLETMQTGTEKELLEYLVGVPDEFAKDIRLVVETAKRAKIEITKKLYELFAQAPKESRKEFALWVNSTVEQRLRSYMFLLLDSKPIPDARLYYQFREGELEWRI